MKTRILHIYMYVSLHTHTRHRTVLALINHEASQKCPIIINASSLEGKLVFSLVLIEEYETSSKSFCNGLHFQKMVLVRGTVQGYYLHLP